MLPILMGMGTVIRRDAYYATAMTAHDETRYAPAATLSKMERINVEDS
jgi:hypothetical protein